MAFAASFALFLSMAVMSPLLDALVRQPFAVGNREAGWFMSANGLATLLFSVAAGWLGDRLGRLRMLVFALLMTALCFALLPWIRDFQLLLLCRFVGGIFDCSAQVLLLSWVVGEVATERRFVAIAAVTAGLPATYLVGPAVVAGVGSEGLWALFAAISAIMVGSGILLMLFGRENPAREEARLPLSALRPHAGALAVPIVFGMVDKFTFAAIALLIGPLVTEIHGLTAGTDSGWLLTGFWAAFLPAMAFAPAFYRRFGYLVPMAVASIAYGATLAAMPFTNFRGAQVTMAGAGVLTALMYLPSLMLLTQRCPPALRGTAMGFYNTLGTGAMILGFAVTGTLSDQNLTAAWMLPGALELACGGALLAILWLGKHSQ
jgi:MFS family permease